jgi:hypothetical protein
MPGAVFIGEGNWDVIGLEGVGLRAFWGDWGACGVVVTAGEAVTGGFLGVAADAGPVTVRLVLAGLLPSPEYGPDGPLYTAKRTQE